MDIQIYFMSVNNTEVFNHHVEEGLFIRALSLLMVVKANYYILDEGFLMLSSQLVLRLMGPWFICQRNLFTWDTISSDDRECIICVLYNHPCTVSASMYCMIICDCMIICVLYDHLCTV